MKTGYYEAFNRDNVHLVDLNDMAIERITPDGLRTTERDYEFDIIVYATCWRLRCRDRRVRPDRVHRRRRQKLRDKWRESPSTYLGLQTVGFPNLITLAGPQGASVSSNFLRWIEDAVDWATELVRYINRASSTIAAHNSYIRDRDYTRVEPTPEAERECDST